MVKDETNGLEGAFIVDPAGETQPLQQVWSGNF